MSRVPGVGVVLAGVVLAGCAAALRSPPTVEELAGGRGGEAPPPALLAAAEAAYARRTVADAHRAADAWLAAARADPASVEGLIGAARAESWLAGRETAAAARETAALRAVQVAQQCLQRAPGSPACRYWLAVALGVQARERRATARDALPRIVALLEEVAAERPGLERAGPHRVLALVLLRAPGWPVGPGDPDRGLAAAREAVALDPDFAPNQLCLAEALVAVGRRADGRVAYERAAGLARRALARGEPDAGEWLEEAERALGPPE